MLIYIFKNDLHYITNIDIISVLEAYMIHFKLFAKQTSSFLLPPTAVAFDREREDIAHADNTFAEDKFVVGVLTCSVEGVGFSWIEIYQQYLL